MARSPETEEVKFAAEGRTPTNGLQTLLTTELSGVACIKRLHLSASLRQFGGSVLSLCSPLASLAAVRSFTRELQRAVADALVHGAAGAIDPMDHAKYTRFANSSAKKRSAQDDSKSTPAQRLRGPRKNASP